MSRTSTKLVRRTALGCLILLSVWQGPASSAVVPLRAQQLFSETHGAMGTTYAIYVYADTAEQAHSEMQAAWDEVDRIDDLLSNYKATSELSRVSREAARGPVTTDAETFRFLQAAMEMSRRTDGAFDITVGKLMRTWGFYEHGGAVPTEAMLTAARSELGWQHVRLDAAKSTVEFVHAGGPAAPGGMELDPGGIGKGYAVDKVVEVFRAVGVRDALISAGSSTVYAMGKPEGKAAWSVAIPDPAGKGRVIENVMLRDTSLSTSACNEKFFVQDGHHYCHIMDPHTLRPVEGVLQTAVVCANATESDALSTATFVLGAKGSEALLAGMPEASAMVITGTMQAQVVTKVRWAGENVVIDGRVR